MKQDALEQLVLKYSDSLRLQALPPLREREADRAMLAADAEHLRGHEGWALDGKALLLLARTHDEALKRLLLEETTKEERLVMLAALARRSFFPLLGLPGQAVFQVPQLVSPLADDDSAEAPEDTLEHRAEAAPVDAPPASPIRRRPPDRQRILNMEKETKRRLDQGVELSGVKGMSMDEIQMLSHHIGSSRRTVGLTGGILRPVDAGNAADGPSHRQSFLLVNRTGEEERT